MNTNSVRFAVVASILVVVVLSMLSTGLGWYFNEMQLKEDQIIEKSLISLQPIITLATRNVEGGNLMKLRNRDAQDLYKTNSGLLFVKMVGTSAGAPATDFSDAIPPTSVEYQYAKEGADARFLSLFAQKSNSIISEKGFYLDKDNSLLLMRVDLGVTNKGTVAAIFSAHELEGVWLGILEDIGLVFLMVLIGALVIGILVGNRITAPVVQVAKNITAISKTLDLTSKVEVDAKNEIGELALWFNTFIDRLEEILASVSKLTNRSTYSSSEISAAVEEQSAIATQQSASVSQITVTMEELSATSSQIAENSNAVVATAASALHESKRGVKAIEALTSKMEEITEDSQASIKDIIDLGKRSNEIGKVMEIINNIADQTKLIAFNAAIEASAAGEAGKRFGVVAVEIRRLADNVMESTEEIHSKIDEIQEAINRLVIASEKSSKRIDEGTVLAADTRSELGSLVQGSQTTNEAASQISVSTQQQKTATEQVLSALKEIEKGIHHSSASMKQTSTMTIDLKDSSLALKKLVGEFKTNNSNSGGE
ncbi:MAG: methyl-accepting chemotaxis protein [Nitrospina sp.]|jgi:methyl-accepting chemotaxis protein|nr:methyl-accepting chemotaxis protein [Nitrospina sp.]